MSAQHGRTRRPLIAHTGMHCGSWRPIGRHHNARHAAGQPHGHAHAVLPAAPAPLLALAAPGLDVRPATARPRGPHPYEVAPATAPLAIILEATA